MKETVKVKVGIQITDVEGGRFPREWLWAEPVFGQATNGVYCLLNTAFYGPFALGDLVEARRKPNGDLIVTGLHRRGGRTSWLLVYDLSVSEERIEQLARIWMATGTCVEGFGGKRVSVAVEARPDGRPTERELEDLEQSGELEFFLLLADPSDTPTHPVFRNLVA